MAPGMNLRFSRMQAREYLRLDLFAGLDEGLGAIVAPRKGM